MAYNWGLFMMKKLLFSMLLLLMTAIGAVAQETLTVYDGETTNSYVPFYGLYADTQGAASECVIPADQLVDMTNGTITEMKFYITQSAAAAWTGTHQVYLGEVDATTLTGIAGPDSYTIVKTASFDATGTELTITFDSPYTYNGGNLLIGTYVSVAGNWKSAYFAGVSQDVNTGWYRNGVSASGSGVKFLPKTTFTYTPGAAPTCLRPTELAASNVAARTVGLAWTNGADETAWQICINGDEDNLVDVTTNPYTLTGLTPETAYTVKVRANCGSEQSFWSNTVSFTTLPACFVPTDLVFSNITASYVSMSWTPGASETHWNFQYKKSTITEWGDDVTALTAPTCYISGLEPGTSYDVRIQSDCESDGTSGTWLTGTFTTYYGIPFIEEFGTSMPANWAQYTGLLSSVMEGTALTSTTYVWSFGSNNGVFDNHARANIYGTGCYKWLTTPTIVMDANVELRFELALTKYSGTLQQVVAGSQADDIFAVLISTDNGATWTVLRQYDNAGSAYVYDEIPTAGEEVVIDLTSYSTGNAIIAFYGESTVSGGDNNLHIDNVSLDYIRTCTKPTALTVSNVLARTADLAWTPGADETAWQICLNDVEDDEHLINVNGEPSYTLTGLTPETPYTVKVRANCGGDVSAWTANSSFTTAISCPVPTALTCTAVTATTATLSWTAGASETAWQICLNNDEENLIDADSNPYTLTGLTAETAYTAKVKAVCGVGDESVWSSVVSFEPTAKIVIGSGSTGSSYLPSHSNYNYSLTQQIYTASEIGGAYDFSSIDFYNAGTTQTRNFDVYLVNTDKASFDNNSDWITVTESDKVFSGSVEMTTGVWTTITFTSDFYYDGVSNLAVIVDDNTGTYSYGMSCRVFSAANQAIYIYNDGTNYNPLSPSGNGTVSATKNQIRLLGTPAEPPSCVKPTALTVSNITARTATISWVAGAGETAWQISLQDDEDDLINVTDTTYTLTGLVPESDYTVKVRTICGEGEFSDWTSNSTFTTLPSCLVPENMVAEVTAHTATLSWTAVGGEALWNLQYKAATDTVWTEVNGLDVATYTITGLDPASPYIARVQADCDLDGESSWLSKVFSTGYAVPFLEEFPTSTIPTSWSRYSGLLSDVMEGTALSSGTYGWTISSVNGVMDDGYHAKVNIYGTSCRYWLVTPSIEMDANVQLTFDLALTDYSNANPIEDPTAQADDKFVVLVSTDNGSTWTILRQYDNAGSEYVYNSIATAGEEVVINLSDYSTGNVKIAFYAESTVGSNGDNDLRVDNVRLDYIPVVNYTITATAGENGTITPAEVTVEAGEDAVFTITPAAGYQIASVMVDTDNDVTDEIEYNDGVYTYTFEDVDANHTIHATFDVVQTYTITVNITGNGNVVATDEDDNVYPMENGVVTVNNDDDVYLDITPAENYQIESVTVDGVPEELDVDDYDGYMVILFAVSGNHTINVTFVPADATDMFEAASMAIYPNPNNGMFSIDFSNIEGDATYEIIDARGAVVETRNINVTNGETMNFNHSLNAGTYFVRIIAADKVYVEQIVVE